MPEVILSAQHASDARRLAHRTYTPWAGSRGHYPNHPRSHLLGRCGEIAVTALLTAEGVDVEEVFRDADREEEADLHVASGGIDVKTWATKYWLSLGRCVAQSQFTKLQRKATAVVWCSAAQVDFSPTDDLYADDRRWVVTVHGWSAVNDLAQLRAKWTGPEHCRILNRQVGLDQIRPWEALLHLIRGAAAD